MNGPDEWAVDLRDVAKTYRRRVRARGGVAVRVHRGEVFGLLGPNGAGKSTLVKIMMTVVRPNRAEGTILGRPVGSKAVLARVGYLPENIRFPGYLTGRQALGFYGALAGLGRAERRRRAAELLELVGLVPAADAKVATYSKGMGQRLGLAQSLMNDPDLVLLDEPTDGVDPVGRREIQGVLEARRGQGKTVFLNSHLLGEAERVCDRVAILVEGLVVRQGTLDELTRDRRYYEIEVVVDLGSDTALQVREALPVAWAAPEAAPPGAAAPARGALPGGQAVELSGAVLRVTGGDPDVIQPVIDALRARGLAIQAVRPVRQSLEDFFIETVREDAAAPPPLGPAPPGRP